MWCVCGNVEVKPAAYTKLLTCSQCQTFHHPLCYEHINEGREKRIERAKQEIPTVFEDDGTQKGWVIKDRAAKKHRKAQTEIIASRLRHIHELVQPELTTDFRCWQCYEADNVSTQAKCNRLELMIHMIDAQSCGYSRKSFIEGGDPKLTRTPDNVVTFLQSLIDPQTETVCADLGAGTGSFSRAMPPGSLCVEVITTRCEEGKRNLPHMTWLNDDALQPSFYTSRIEQFDLIIGNPDFEVGMQFLYLALSMIRPNGRVIFLLPTNYFEGSKVRQSIFRLMDFHIETEYKLGHITFYSEIQHGQKLTCDSLFVFRRGRGLTKYEYRTVCARIAGFLDE